jgi:tetratricopeptide (TPR) repeat protein
MDPFALSTAVLRACLACALGLVWATAAGAEEPIAAPFPASPSAAAPARGSGVAPPLELDFIESADVGTSARQPSAIDVDAYEAPAPGFAAPASAEPGVAPPDDRMTIEDAVNMLDLFQGSEPVALEQRAADAAPEAGEPAPWLAIEASAAAEERAASEAAAPLRDEISPLSRGGAMAALRDPRGAWRALRPELEQLAARLPALARGAVNDLKEGRITPRAEILSGTVLTVLLVLLLFAVRSTRGRSNVVVCVEYPSSLRGTFTVQLAKRAAGRSRSGRIKTPADAQRAKGRTSATKHVVSRETQFRDVRARRYYVSVDGIIQTADSEEIVSTHLDEKEVTLRPGATSRVAFDFNPRACPVEVRVLWDKRPVNEAHVARWGSPGSLRLARGPVQYTLDRGTHTLVVGSSDRVAEIPVEVNSFQPMQLVVDLADRAHLLFSGCPPAVESYLAGDVPAAARALEREDQVETSNLLLARFHLDQGHRENAAKHFESAGRLLEAAELHQSLTHFEKAAKLFEQVGEDNRAAEMYRSAGKLLRAGDAYARADAYDSAVECFKKAGDTSRWIEALAKKGEYFEAATAALENGDNVRAIQCLNQVVVGQPHYPEAAVRLAEVYQQEGHPELAIHKLEELIASQSAERVPVEAVDLLARELEETGEYERALQTLERLRNRDASFPNVSTRIEDLRKRRSKEANSSVESASSPDAATLDAFSHEFRYEILEELGRGGMGIVFKARDRRLGRVVALKRLPDNLRDHPKAVELFLREARAAAALNHNNIVTLFDAGQEDGTYYITMELLEGMPLPKILKSRKRLSADHAIKLGGQIATGLQYAHEEGIVHRDIKTANLFFTKKKVVKIMDFGLAKMTEEVRRSTTVIGGTPYYMAPEQSAGERVDHRADLYALGVTFYEMLTGRVPFREGDVAFHHRHTQPPDPRETVAEIPVALSQLVLRLLEKRPDDRIQSAKTVCEELQRIAQELG